MNEDFLSKVWADNHGTVTGDLYKLGQVVAKAMQRLNTFQFDAPWRRDAETKACGQTSPATCTD